MKENVKLHNAVKSISTQPFTNKKRYWDENNFRVQYWIVYKGFTIKTDIVIGVVIVILCIFYQIYLGQTTGITVKKYILLIYILFDKNSFLDKINSKIKVFKEF